MGRKKVGSKNAKRVAASFSESLFFVSCVLGVKSIGSVADKKFEGYQGSEKIILKGPNQPELIAEARMKSRGRPFSHFGPWINSAQRFRTPKIVALKIIPDLRPSHSGLIGHGKLENWNPAFINYLSREGGGKNSN